MRERRLLLEKPQGAGTAGETYSRAAGDLPDFAIERGYGDGGIR